MSIKSTKRETSDFISFRCFYEHKKCCLFCSLVCVFMFFMLFMLVKFSCKKNNKSLKLVLITSTIILLLKLIRMLKYRINTYKNSYWQQQTLEKKSSEKMNQWKKRWNSAVRWKRIVSESFSNYCNTRLNWFSLGNWA